MAKRYTKMAITADKVMPNEIVDLVARSELSGLKEDVHELNLKIDGLASKGDIAVLSNTIRIIAEKQDRSMTPNYGLLVSLGGLAFLILTGLGGFAYYPIKSDQSELRADLQKMQDSVIYRRRYEDNRAELKERLKDIEGDIGQRVTVREFDASTKELSRRLDRLERDK